VPVGVRPDGSVIGQTIADKTSQGLAQVLRRFDLPIPVETERIAAGTDGLKVLVMSDASNVFATSWRTQLVVSKSAKEL
jgi:hypothetical protein